MMPVQDSRGASVDQFVQEVSNARIYDGVHYRASTEVGTAMGIEIGENAVKTFSQAAQ